MPERVDATPSVRSALAQARPAGRNTLLLIVSAENCPGCDTLKGQLDEPAVAEQLQAVEVVKISAGDLYAGAAGKVDLGTWTLESPGFPTSWCFAVDDDGLRFSALALGPLDAFAPEHDLASVLAGTSVWVHEAGGLTLQACAGDLCVPLRGSDGFRGAFQVAMPAEGQSSPPPSSDSASTAFKAPARVHGARLPVVLLGAGTRATSVYGPLLQGALSDRFELVGVVSRGPDRLGAAIDALGVPGAHDLQAAVGWGAQAAIVCVSSPENARVAREVFDRGLPTLLETPLALDPAEAAALAAAAPETTEVAEQNPRFPWMRFAVELARSGALGRLLLASSEGSGYRYHASAVARALLRQPGAHAVAQRVFADHDFGRGLGPEGLLVGTVTIDGGALFSLRDAEPIHAGAWPGGRWALHFERGGLTLPGAATRWVDGRSEPLAIDVQTAGGGTRRIEAGGVVWEDPELPDGALDDDALAVARCLLDWLARLDGAESPTGWSAADAAADLAWIAALERSAALGGARIAIR